MKPGRGVIGTHMKPVLSEAELVLFTSFLGHADSYLEFGAGGSTCLAASRVRRSVVSVDSSRDWMQRVAAACAARQGLTPELLVVDIGPLGQWGWPADNSARSRWPDYHEAVWQAPERAEADVFMVDGRFRVACVMQILLRCRPNAVICVHDFSERPDYHPIRDVAHELASADTLSVFQRRAGQDEGRIRAMLEQHRFQPR